MTRKLSLTVLLTGMAVSAIIIVVTVSSSINRQRIKAEQLAAVTTTQTTPLEIGYYLKEYEGELAIFRGESKTPYKRLGVSVNLMSEYDKNLLSNGIFARTQKELNALIEDYTS